MEKIGLFILEWEEKRYIVASLGGAVEAGKEVCRYLNIDEKFAEEMAVNDYEYEKNVIPASRMKFVYCCPRCINATPW